MNRVNLHGPALDREVFILADESPVQPDLVRPDPWRRARIWWQRILRISRRAPRRLRLCESLPLGERRFVAVVEFERSRFLLGGTSASLVLLARLENGGDEIQATGGNRASGMGEQEQP